jgi:hypothetical protein
MTSSAPRSRRHSIAGREGGGGGGGGGEQAPLLNGNFESYTIPDGDDNTVNLGKMVKIEETREWRLAVTLAWVVLIHLFVDFLLLDPPLEKKNSLETPFPPLSNQYHIHSNHHYSNNLLSIKTSTNHNIHVPSLPYIIPSCRLSIRTSTYPHIQP